MGNRNRFFNLLCFFYSVSDLHAQEQEELQLGMDPGVSSSLPSWCVDFFQSFDWDRDRLLTMLTSLPCKRSLDVPDGQLRHPDFICCSLCAPETDNAADVSEEDCVLPDSTASSSSRPRSLRETKYGRCPSCQLARQPWIFRTGKHAGQAALVCKNFFVKHGKKCFKFHIMNREQIESMHRCFRSQHASVENRLKRAGRADAQARS